MTSSRSAQSWWFWAPPATVTVVGLAGAYFGWGWSWFWSGMILFGAFAIVWVGRRHQPG